MINFYDSKRSISKKKLAEFAEVSPRTFSYYLETRHDMLNSLGCPSHSKKLNPAAVRYVCEDYCIDLPAKYQDQKALSSAPKLLREQILRG